ncbi:uncharacterized protein LOC121834038 isoform X2 [Ixodes scapularis]|uniref:uncharacterized protein LOC121834010 isoform X3 n=1 Tax=Ixodes scapularis TaxID=6945 RepID=UPI001C39129D|nr:uncharacterized protein LOC121834010 isoform X3 [Ixodes scapularis]XP_042143712.1 uncharacterized protein LOC121834038 isoform X2 [Ixodes scapularis]
MAASRTCRSTRVKPPIVKLRASFLCLEPQTYDGSSENQREYHEGDKRVEASSKGQTPKTWTISNQGDKLLRMYHSKPVQYEEPSPTVYHRYTSSPAASGARMPCSHALHSPARTSYFERPHGQDAPTPRLWEWETTGSP